MSAPDPETPALRAQRACSSCSRQKVRCDGQKPCGRCVTLKRTSECEYLPSQRGRMRNRKIRAAEAMDVELHNKGREEEFNRWKRNTEHLLPKTAALWGKNDTANAPDKLTTLPLPGDVPNPLAVLAEASSIGDSSKRQEDTYYAPLARVLKDDAPHIMTLISVSEAESLFDIYFQTLHPHFPILDREQCAPVAVARRNNFLFNATARTKHVSLWERLKRAFAVFEMERMPKDKNIEVVQAHLLYAQWNLIRPAHFEQDLTWIRVGLAARTALDINLHRIALITQSDTPRWVLRNILRTWLGCYIVDRTMSSQLGKPSSVRGENGIRLYLDMLRRDDVKQSIEDVWVASLAVSEDATPLIPEWTLIWTRGMDLFRNEAADYASGQAYRFSSQTTSLPDIAHAFSRQFRQWRERSEALAKPFTNGIAEVVMANIGLYELYARLVAYSYSFQRSNDHSTTDLPAALIEYHTAAIRLIEYFDKELDGRRFTRACPDFVFTILTYAAVSALRTIDSNRQTVLAMAERASSILAQAACTPDHLPASQSALIARVIASKNIDPVLPSFSTGPSFVPPAEDFFNMDWLTAPTQPMEPSQDLDLMFTHESLWLSLLDGTDTHG